MATMGRLGASMVKNKLNCWIGWVLVIASVTYCTQEKSGKVLLDEDAWSIGSAVQRHKTLVIYIFSDTDPEYADNLRFFVDEAIRAGDGCDYIIVLQQGDGLSDPDPLPALPSNARYLRHPNECFDLGTVGWVLRTQADTSKYRHFVWLNSSVRGPFFPSYLRGRLHWTRPLTVKLTASVKLVGATINCGGYASSQPHPHVQSYLVATDSAGLGVLLRVPSVFACHSEFSQVVLHSEIGASRAILEAGYGLDCLMARYQGLDWRNPALQDPSTACNAGRDPLMPASNDGVDIDPLEVMFVKVKRAHVVARWPHVTAAAARARWLRIAPPAATGSPHAAGHSDVEGKSGAALSSALLEEVASNALLKSGGGGLLHECAIKDARQRGQSCFDHEYYLAENARDLAFFRDLPDPPGKAWDHYLKHGVYEWRPVLWTC